MFITLTEVHLGIVEAIRQVLIMGGYLPDRVIYNTVNSFQTAKQSLTKPFVEVVGALSILKEGQNLNNTIFVQRNEVIQGRLGASGSNIYQPKTDNNFDVLTMPTFTSHINYIVTAVCKTNADIDLCSELIAQALGLSNYKKLKGCKMDLTKTDDFSIYFVRMALIEIKEYTEVKFIYQVKDVFLEKATLIDTTKALLQAEGQINNKNYPTLFEVAEILQSEGITLSISGDLPEREVIENLINILKSSNDTDKQQKASQLSDYLEIKYFIAISGFETAIGLEKKV